MTLVATLALACDQGKGVVRCGPNSKLGSAIVATLALGSRPRLGVARLRESRGKKPESQKEGSPGVKAKALERCGPRESPGVITYSRESKEVRGSVRE